MSDIKPALTAAEWAAGFVGTDSCGVFLDKDGLNVSYDSNGAADGPIPNRHGVMALANAALPDDPRKLTWEDVERLAGAANTMERRPKGAAHQPDTGGPAARTSRRHRRAAAAAGGEMTNAICCCRVGR
jgi:hypothetical protein